MEYRNTASEPRKSRHTATTTKPNLADPPAYSEDSEVFGSLHASEELADPGDVLTEEKADSVASCMTPSVDDSEAVAQGPDDTRLVGRSWGVTTR